MENISKKIVDIACEALYDKKAENILVLDIQGMTVIADYFILCDGRSNLQVQALSDALEDALDAQGIHFLRTEGYDQGRWVVLDYGDVLIHIFQKDEREFYNLERLWKRGDNASEYPPRDAQETQPAQPTQAE